MYLPDGYPLSRRGQDLKGMRQNSNSSKITKVGKYSADSSNNDVRHFKGVHANIEMMLKLSSTDVK
jgi:hypothetical protein